MIEVFRQHSSAHFAVLCGTAALALAGAAPAAAEDEDFERTVIIMRACAQIADMAARVTCYDNTMAQGVARAAPATAPVPATVTAPQAQGLGAEQVVPDREHAREQQDENLVARVTAVATVSPGLFTISLADGSQWTCVDEAPFGYAVPRAGSSVRIERGSLGSYLLRFDSQQSLRVRRVR